MLIKVGDEIKNWQGDIVLVESVEVGLYGLLVKGRFVDHALVSECYVPYEVPRPIVERKYWKNWFQYSYATLESGTEIGIVALVRGKTGTIQDYDKQWQETQQAFDEPARQEVY